MIALEQVTRSVLNCDIKLSPIGEAVMGYGALAAVATECDSSRLYVWCILRALRGASYKRSYTGVIVVTLFSEPRSGSSIDRIREWQSWAEGHSRKNCACVDQGWEQSFLLVSNVEIGPFLGMFCNVKPNAQLISFDRHLK